MRIFLTGGSGFIGRFLTFALAERGHEITVLSRNLKKPSPFPPRIFVLEADPTKVGPWQKIAGDHDAIINLAGFSIFNRWTEKVKNEIFESRVLTTKNLVEALSHRKQKEIHFLSASGVGYYGYHHDKVIDENDGPGYDFLARLASAWEQTAVTAEKFEARVVLCRFGIVLGRHGGALARLTPLFKCYLGATLGNGIQWFSWIHEQDLINIFLFLLKHPEVQGPVNFTAPHPVRNRELTQTLSAVLRKPALPFPVPEFLLRIVFGESADMLLKGQRVLPQKLLGNGFLFKFPILSGALQDLLAQN
jgi:uncharacterized protein (TIGR01777 family)